MLIRYEGTGAAFDDYADVAEATMVAHSSEVITAARLAGWIGMRSIDTALPQAWVDDVVAATGDSPVGSGIVWSYDLAANFGRPAALTFRGRDLLLAYGKAKYGLDPDAPVRAIVGTP